MAWDHGSLVAVRVSDRQRYAEMMSRMMGIGSIILLSTLDFDSARLAMQLRLDDFQAGIFGCR